jgi:hypothetical protein
MNKQIEKLLATAAAEIGTTENPPNSNTVKYNDWYYGRRVSGSNYAWCSVFVTWCFYQSGLIALTWGTLNAAKQAVAEGAKNWKPLAQSKNAWFTSGYKPGDVVVFDFDGNKTIDHVGIVESVSADGKTLTCLEGNTSASTAGSQSNGSCVARKTRSVTIVHGVFRPDYAPDPAPEVKPFTIPDWAKDGVTYAVDSGLLKPSGDAEDYWTRAVNRIELAVVLERLRNLK